MLSHPRKNIPSITLLQLTSDVSCAVVAVLIAFRFRGYLSLSGTTLGPASIFAITTVCLNGTFGLYRPDHKLGFGEQIVRVFFAAAIAAPAAYLMADLFLRSEGFSDSIVVA